MTTAIYTHEQWTADREFKAEPGQQITGDIYEEFFNCLPPKSLPRAAAEYALQELGVPVHAGFMLGEPHSTDTAGKNLYMAFGSND